VGKNEETTTRHHRLTAGVKIALSDQDGSGQSPAGRIVAAIEA